MSILTQQYIPPPWEWHTYYQATSNPAGDTLMTFAAWGWLVLDLPGLAATAQPTAANKAPAVGHCICTFPRSWFQIVAVDPADHGYFRLTLAPYGDPA